MDMFLGLAKLNNLYIKVIFFLAHKKSAKNIMYNFFVVCLGQQKTILIVEAWYCAQNTGFRSRFSFFCFHLRRMTFGKVNELGQFIREAEPEPDVKKSKGRTHTHIRICSWKLFFSSLSLTHTCTCFVLCELALSYDLCWSARCLQFECRECVAMAISSRWCGVIVLKSNEKQDSLLCPAHSLLIYFLSIRFHVFSSNEEMGARKLRWGVHLLISFKLHVSSFLMSFY